MMKTNLIAFTSVLLMMACADNDLSVYPEDSSFPFRVVVDEEEGGALPGADEYSLEVKFADYIGTLPAKATTVHFTIGDFDGNFSDVSVDKIFYEVELADCVWERDVEFTFDTNTGKGSMTIPVDSDLGTVPESVEVVFVLSGEDSKGAFSFAIADVKSDAKVIAGTPSVFEYETLENDLAGEWEMEIADDESFELFKSVFAPLNNELVELTFEDITGSVTLEFESGEMKIVIELEEEEEITECVNGEEEKETENKVIEIEAEYEAEDGELVLEGSHFIIGDDGETEDELDFIAESSYSIDEEAATISFLKVVDEDNFRDGEELFKSDNGVAFTFYKD
jgi:hypothetical protein